MRGLVLLSALFVLGACSGGDPSRAPSTEPSAPLTAGEKRARIEHPGQAATTMRSGPQVPALLPAGFSTYPGAKVVSSTVVERVGRRRILLVLQTPDAVPQVMRFYRAEARAAGASLALDLGSGGRASLGGVLAGSDGNFSVAARRDGDRTRVEFAAD